jgi:hypothetical protein
MALTSTSYPKKRMKTGGRARGTPNLATTAGRELAARLVNDRAYRESLRERLLAGRLHPAVEQMLWYYAMGKPKESLELSGSIGTRDVRELSTEELLAELEQHQRTTALLLTEHHGQRHSQGDWDGAQQPAAGRG